MMLFVAALLVMTIYLAAYGLRSRMPDRLRLDGAWMLASACAGVMAILIVSYGTSLPGWQGSQRLAWTGAIAHGQSEIRIGDMSGALQMRWPNGSPTPSLHARCNDESCDVEITGGGGFVQDAQRRLLNGAELSWDAPRKLRPNDTFEAVIRHRTFKVWGLGRIPRYPAYLFGERLVILHGGIEVAGADIPRLTFLRTRTQVRSLDALLDQSLGEWRACYWSALNPRTRSQTDCSQFTRDPKQLASIAAGLERWTRGKLLAVAQSGPPRILDTDDRSSVRIANDTKLDVYFSNTVRVPFRILKTDEGVALRFLPPWRSSTPAPPSTDVVITSSPLPGDHAFTLPVDTAQSLRAVIPIDARASALAPPPGAPPGPRFADAPDKWPSEISRSEVDAGGNSSLVVTTLADMPNAIGLSAISAIAWLALMVSLWGLARGSRDQSGSWKGLQPADTWVIAGLALTVWVFCALRCLLALRYAGFPEDVDSLALSGVTWSALGLTVAPFLVIRTARMCADVAQSRQPRDAGKLIALTAVVVGLGVLVVWLAQHALWPNISADYRLSTTKWLIYLGVSAAVVIVMIVRGVSQYNEGPDGEETGTPWAPQRIRNWIEGAIRSAEFFPRYLENAVDLHWSAESNLRQNLVQTVKILAAVLVVMALTHVLPSGLVIAKEVIAPLVLSLPFVCILLASRGVLAPNTDTRIATWYTLALVLLNFVVVVTLVPLVLLRDPGGVFATLALFIPTCLVLLSGWRPLKVAVMSSVCFLVAATVAFMLYVDYRPLTEQGMLQTATTRFAALRYAGAQGHLLWLNAVDSGGLAPFRPRLQALQHQWENAAMAHRGGALGVPFGTAPVRSSTVRQDTLQFDSTFSFFILGEHGLIGGLALLVLYTAPLLLVLGSAYRQFDLAHGFAIVLASAFALEGVTQALMNVGVLPTTGRCLPLLGAGSVTDLLRWTIFFRLMAQMIPFRAEGGTVDRTRYDSSILSPVQENLSATTPSHEPPRRFASAVALTMAPIVALVAFVGFAATRIIADPTQYEEYSMKGILRTVDQCAAGDPYGCFQQAAPSGGSQAQRTPFLRLTGDQIVLDRRLQDTVWPESLLVQEVVRFNLMTPAEKLQGIRSSDTEAFCQNLLRVSTIQQYDALLGSVRTLDAGFGALPPPSLFRLQRAASASTGGNGTLGDFDDDSEPAWSPEAEELCGLPADLQLSVASNTEYDRHTSFRSPPTREHLPVVRLEGSDRPLLGPAWINGRWRLAVDPGHAVPWAPHLATALEQASSSFSTGFSANAKAGSQANVNTASQTNANTGSQANARELTLALNGPLQTSLDAFVAQNGRRRHTELIASLTPRERAIPTRSLRKVLPPRVAISIVEARDGAVVGMAGWPRMNPAGSWASRGASAELIPSYRWVDERAPRILRLRYQGDRNFDRLLMGSSTKPLWASAALSIHPSLATSFGVSGGGGSSNEVFGIPIVQGRPWHVSGSAPLNGRSTNGWADLSSFLGRSDNRYQIAMGFLTLALPDGNGGVRAAGTSPSKAETMNLSTAWGQFPDFDPRFGFSASSNRELRGLVESPVAINLKKQFGIGIKTGELSFRPSFWTGREDDDVQPMPSRLQSLIAISPAAPSLEFDAPDMNPRQFVSLLLGGQTNRWANVDFAGAFATVIKGKPVVPHILAASTPTASAGRQEFATTARLLHDGLSAVVNNPAGTAYRGLSGARGKLFDALKPLGYEVYAKTGTLAEESLGGTLSLDTSRIVLALVRWRQDRSDVESGLVFSVVIEHGRVGLATQWLNDFLVANADEIRKRLTPATTMTATTTATTLATPTPTVSGAQTVRR
jgi:cell division protein FtsI/penicillin-binding protein 2/cell division protein FtsW (lipid II flippase)